MQKLNQKGFSSLVILIIIVMGLMGGTGYYVYKNNQSDGVKDSSIKQPLIKFTDPTKSYTLNYPKDWRVKTPASIKDWSDDAQLTMISYPGAHTNDPMTVSFDKTPKQAQLQSKVFEEDAKSDPKAYEKITINGFPAYHQRTEWGDQKVIETREDRYLIINKDQSSLLFIIMSKVNDETGKYDASAMLPDFIDIVKSVKFLR
jgi:hypothetical protein